MSTKVGIWEVSSGKGDRQYIKCEGVVEEGGVGVMHPEQLAGLNGVGMYGAHHLYDLRNAINNHLTGGTKIELNRPVSAEIELSVLNEIESLLSNARENNAQLLAERDEAVGRSTNKNQRIAEIFEDEENRLCSAMYKVKQLLK